jgi:hypothetical protein
VGILAAVAAPAYRDYTIRGRVVEMNQAARCAARRVDDFYQAHGACRVGGPGRLRDHVTQNMNPLAVFHGEVIVQAVGSLARELGPRNIFAMRAVCSDGRCDGARIVEWICSPARRGGCVDPPSCRSTSRRAAAEGNARL